VYQNPVFDFISNPYFLFSLIFWLAMFLVVFIFKKKRASFEFFFPFFFMARTKRFNRLLTKIGQKWPRFWKAFWTVGIFVSFAFLVYGFWYLTSNLFTLIFNPKIQNAVIPLIPGVTIDFFQFITYLILPILFVVTLHECGHGVAATAEKLELKSTGVLAAGAFFLIGFGAFVELNEQTFRSRRFPRLAKMRIFTAGTFVNAIEFGIAFLLIMNFSSLMSLGYSQRYFAIQGVSTNAEGGFNANNLVAGEVCVAINGTSINLDQNANILNDILTNKTDLRCKPGDTLIFKLYQPTTRTFVNREVLLGPRNFIGFTVSKENDSAARIDTVYTVEQGGNNFGTVFSDWIITSVNDTNLDYANNDTFESRVIQLQAGNKVNISVDGQGNVEINVNYYPNVAGAFVFNSTYLGFTYSYDSVTTVKIERVFSTLEGGNNEGNIKAGDIITAVNGKYIDKTSHPLASIIDTDIHPAPDGTLNFSTADGRTLTLRAAAIPVTPVFIGLIPQDYWIPQNFFTELLGPTFPSWLEQEFWWFLMISVSLTMFNMMPVPIFDGNRVVKELVDWGVEKKRGARYQRRKREGVRIQFNEKNLEYNFPEAEILDVERVTYESDPQFTFENGRDFKLLKSWGADTYDGMSFDVASKKRPIDQETLLVDYVYSHDQNQGIKKNILRAISIVTSIIIIANFVLSAVNFGKILFWV